MSIPIIEVVSGIIGLVVGSFLNVVIDRGYRDETLGGRSHCDSCKKTLSFFELIPIVSFIWQKGACRSCRTALSLQYPLVELGTAASFSFAAYGLLSVRPPEGIFFVFLIWFFVIAASAIVIFVSDLKYYIIPDRPLLVLFLSGVAAAVTRAFYFYPRVLLWDIAGAAFFSFMLAALWFLSRGRWLGFGDAKLMGALALLLGFPASTALFFFSFWLGAAWAVLLIVARRKKLHEKMPFGPFILLAALAAYFWGERFLAYTGLLSLF